ncbi:hypothetical protein LY78DRAFT_50025 [Colletotrichum sublineola]|nr:hypothetical protein LY78DRAFT_50025 [Colletotrichum sublineola]
MKSTIAAIGLLASLASASAHQPRHFHWRRDNSTEPASMTTLTVQVTEVATVTSCAPTITNCPARSANLSASDLHTYVVTNTVVLTEVVCPVTEAASISKSLIEQHSTGGLPGSTLPAPAVTPTAAPSVPLNSAGVTKSAQDATATKPPTTGGDDESEEDCPAEDGDVETTVTQIISTKTLTMTVGKGSTASVVTTPASTVYVTIGGPSPTAAAAADAVVASNSPAAAAVTGEANAGGEESDDEDDDCPADDDVVTLSTTVTVAPYPTNGTASGGAAKPTGYNKRSNKLF